MFKELRPRHTRGSVYLGDKVKVNFYKKEIDSKPKLSILIGKDVAKRLGVKAKDRLKFYLNEENPNMWQLKKIEEDSLDTIGFSVAEAGSMFKIQVAWNFPIPEKCDKGTVYCAHTFLEGGLRIYLPACSQEDRTLYYGEKN